MIASVQPKECRTRIHWPMRRTPTHRKWSQRFCRSGEALPERAAQTLFLPADVAPAGASRGNVPAPAMRPRGGFDGGVVIQEWVNTKESRGLPPRGYKIARSGFT